MSNAIERNYYWNDLQVGFKYETPSRSITESDVIQFAGLTADYNRVHVDNEFAKRSVYGQKIAHGLLIGSILSGLNTRTIVNQRIEASIVGLLEIGFKFPKPTFVGDTIFGRVEVVGKRETSGQRRGIIDFKRYAINQRDEVVCECDVKMLVLKNP